MPPTRTHLKVRADYRARTLAHLKSTSHIWLNPMDIARATGMGKNAAVTIRIILRELRDEKLVISRPCVDDTRVTEWHIAQ